VVSSIFKGVKYLLAFVIFAPIALYVVLLLLNLSDEDKSAQVLAFEDFIAEKQQLTTKQNAYISLVGITAKPDENIHVIGLERMETLADSKLTTKPLPFNDFFDVDAISAQLNSIFSSCQRGEQLDENCQKSLLNQQEQIATLISENQLLIQRYRMITQLPHWHEILPASIVYTDGMRYQFLLSLQKLNMLAIWQMTIEREYNPDEVARLLDQQGIFVRNILSSTHMLLTKMIAVSAVRSHFNWLGFIISNNVSNSEQSSEQLIVKQSVVNALSQPLTSAELSLDQIIIGEWLFTQSVYQQAVDETDGEYAWTNFFLLPLFSQQATSNLHAAVMKEAVENLTVETNRAKENQLCLTDKSWQMLTWYSYNPIGKLIICAPGLDFSSYKESLNSVETLRKSVLAKLTR